MRSQQSLLSAGANAACVPAARCLAQDRHTRIGQSQFAVILTRDLSERQRFVHEPRVFPNYRFAIELGPRSRNHAETVVHLDATPVHLFLGRASQARIPIKNLQALGGQGLVTPMRRRSGTRRSGDHKRELDWSDAERQHRWR